MQEHSIEEGFCEIENILAMLDSTEISLDEAFELYKAGMEELKYCNSKIEATKKAVQKYTLDGSLELFDEVED